MLADPPDFDALRDLASDNEDAILAFARDILLPTIEPSPTSTSKPLPGDDGSNTGLIAGLVVSSVAFLLIVTAVTIVFVTICKAHHKKRYVCKVSLRFSSTVYVDYF